MAASEIALIVGMVLITAVPTIAIAWYSITRDAHSPETFQRQDESAN